VENKEVVSRWQKKELEGYFDQVNKQLRCVSIPYSVTFYKVWRIHNPKLINRAKQTNSKCFIFPEFYQSGKDCQKCCQQYDAVSITFFQR
jgi:hypothetical protein